MRHGKDFMVDKPGMTTLEQLAEARKVQAETKRIYSILYSERHENKATVKAGDLVKAGAIGKVIQTDRPRTAPHECAKTRPAWFFEKEQLRRHPHRHRVAPVRPVPLLHRARPKAEIVASQVGQRRTIPQYPGLEDFGDVMLRGNGGTGYIRVDWFTPDGLSTWGDGRLTILGTDGFIEIRKNVDIGGRPGGNHLFLVDQKETRYIDCSDVAAALRDAARGRRAEPHGDVDAAGARLPRDGARPRGGSAGRTALTTPVARDFSPAGSLEQGGSPAPQVTLNFGGAAQNVSSTRTTDCRGSTSGTRAWPASTRTTGAGDDSVSCDARSSAARCALSGACGDPIRSHAV